MATAFSYSGTGLQSAIQSGSGGITSTDTSVEVDSIPSDLIAGDDVKVALGSASDWSAGSGETVHGTIGTIGGGVNGGTDITGLTRGAEGTTVSSFSEGAVARVGVQGRDDAERGTALNPLMPSDGLIDQNFAGAVTSAYVNVSRTNSKPEAGRILCMPVFLRSGVTVGSVSVGVATVGDSGGTSQFALANWDDPLPGDKDVVATSAQATFDSSGFQEVSLTYTVDRSGAYVILSLHTGYSTRPNLKSYDSRNAYNPNLPIIRANDAFGGSGVFAYGIQSSSATNTDFSSFSLTTQNFVFPPIMGIQT